MSNIETLLTKSQRCFLVCKDGPPVEFYGVHLQSVCIGAQAERHVWITKAHKIVVATKVCDSFHDVAVYDSVTEFLHAQHKCYIYEILPKICKDLGIVQPIKRID